jgi:hypothetical protein
MKDPENNLMQASSRINILIEKVRSTADQKTVMALDEIKNSIDTQLSSWKDFENSCLDIIQARKPKSSYVQGISLHSTKKTKKMEVRHLRDFLIGFAVESGMGSLSASRTFSTWNSHLSGILGSLAECSNFETLNPLIGEVLCGIAEKGNCTVLQNISNFQNKYKTHIAEEIEKADNPTTTTQTQKFL